jgi:hypothetical protein
MPINGCRYTFETIVQKQLPKLFDRLLKEIEHPIPLSAFAKLRVGGAAVLRSENWIPQSKGDLAGAYVILDRNGKPLYVGISRTLGARLRGHVVASSHNTASLAYQMASKNCPVKTRAHAARSRQFAVAFLDAKAELRDGSVAIVEIENAVVRHLFEVYAAMKLGTTWWNSFETH